MHGTGRLRHRTGETSSNSYTGSGHFREASLTQVLAQLLLKSLEKNRGQKLRIDRDFRKIAARARGQPRLRDEGDKAKFLLRTPASEAAKKIITNADGSGMACTVIA